MNGDPTPTDPDSLVPLGSGVFATEVLILWERFPSWHVHTVLIRQEDAVGTFAPWDAAPGFSVDGDLAKDWNYLSERVLEGRGGNGQTYELEGFEVPTADEIAPIVNARAAEAVVAEYGPLGHVTGTILPEHGIVVDFRVLADDRGYKAIVATGGQPVTCTVTDPDGEQLSPTPYQSIDSWQYAGAPSWALSAIGTYQVDWKGTLVTVSLDTDGNTKIAPPGFELASPEQPAESEPIDYYLLTRTPPPRDLAAGHLLDRIDAGVLFGEQTEWGCWIVNMYRALAAPRTRELFPEPPRRGDDVLVACAYWTPLLHLLIYTLGWSRPDLGLSWWYEAGKPTDDPRLAFVSEVWDTDGQLDWFAAWLWTSWPKSDPLLDPIRARPHPDKARVDTRWLKRQAGDSSASGIPNPGDGRGDELHLHWHCTGPLRDDVADDAVLVRTSRTDRCAVLSLETTTGWYQQLARHGARLPDLNGRSWRVDVHTKPAGWLGTYRQSRGTGRWFTGRHQLHERGNPSE